MKCRLFDCEDELESESTMYILVKPTSRKDVTLIKLERSDTIKHVKAMIQFKEGVPEERQTLIYKAKVLDDGETLANCNVESWSMVHAIFCPEEFDPKVKGVNMTVKVPGWEPILMEVKPWYTGREIKAVMASTLGCNLDDHVVSHGRKLIADWTTITEGNISRQLKSPLILWPVRHKVVIVVRGCGWEELISVSESDTVQSVKKMVEDFAQVELSKLELFYGDRNVFLDDDEKTLAFYHVQKISTFWVFGSCSKISIKMPQVGETILLSVYKIDSVKDIKQYICEKMGIPCSSQSLFYKGHLLEEAKCLKTYNLEANCDIYATFGCGNQAGDYYTNLIFREKESNPKEYLVERPYGRKSEDESEYGDSFEIKLNNSHTIFDVKAILESMLDLPICEYQAYCYSRMLKDWETIQDCSITDWKSCVSSPMELYVQLSDGAEAFAVQAQSSDLIANVLDKIPPEVTGSVKGQPCLFLDGVRLASYNSLAQYGIQSGSSVCLNRLVQINVTGPKGSVTKVDVNPCYKIKAVKEKIEETCGIPVGLQSLTYADDELDDDETIGHYEAVLGSLWALRWTFCLNSWSFFWPSYKAILHP